MSVEWTGQTGVYDGSAYLVRIYCHVCRLSEQIVSGLSAKWRLVNWAKTHLIDGRPVLPRFAGARPRYMVAGDDERRWEWYGVG